MSADPYAFDARRWAGEASPRPRPVQVGEVQERKLGPRFRGADEWMRDPRPPAIVEGVAWAGCITVLVAESGTGKTFLLLDVASAVAADRTWRGRVTRGGTVCYVTWEGDALGTRLCALREAGLETDGIELLRLTAPLSAKARHDGNEGFSQGEAMLAEALADLTRRLEADGRPPVALLILDTLRASMAGSEDSSEDTACYLRAVRRVVTPYPGAGVLVAHHAGWQDSTETRRKRERGSSAIRGNVDATLYVEAEYDEETHSARLVVTTLKIRDQERPAPLHLIRRRVELRERDEFGRVVTSCVIDHDSRTSDDRQAEEQAARQAEEQAGLVELLKVVRDSSPTSRDQIRTHMRLKKATVADRLTEALRLGLVLEAGRRGDPFRLSSEGLELLFTRGE